MKASPAITHHEGGRQARTPTHNPSENANAAQNSGWRVGWSSWIIALFARLQARWMGFMDERKSGQRWSSITDSM
jgi:hypothetical protein